MTLTRAAALPGVRLPLPLPAPSLRLPLERDPRRGRYFFLRHPDFSRTPSPWRYVEQMGEAHRLELDDVRVTAITRPRGPLVTEVRFVVEPSTTQ